MLPHGLGFHHLCAGKCWSRRSHRGGGREGEVDDVLAGNNTGIPAYNADQVYYVVPCTAPLKCALSSHLVRHFRSLAAGHVL